MVVVSTVHPPALPPSLPPSPMCPCAGQEVLGIERLSQALCGQISLLAPGNCALLDELHTFKSDKSHRQPRPEVPPRCLQEVLQRRQRHLEAIQLRAMLMQDAAKRLHEQVTSNKEDSRREMQTQRQMLAMLSDTAHLENRLNKRLIKAMKKATRP